MKIIYKSITTIFFLSVLFNTAFAQSLPVPGLVSPTNSSISQEPNTLLDWSASSGQTAYEYRIGLTNNLNSAQKIQVTTSQATTANLLFGTLYYWQVRAIKTTAPLDSSNWSAIWSFTTIDQISLVAPTNGATNQSANEILDWSSLSGLTFYDFQWDTTANFNSPLFYFASVSSGTSQATTSNLRFGTTYYWRVRGRHSTDTTLWSTVRSFTTIDQVSLVAPVNQATNQSPNEILDWTSLSGLTFYDFQWDTTANFNSPLFYFASVSSGTSQATTSNLRFGTTYYWRVRGRHSTDTTLWSTVRSFTTIDQISLVAPVNQAINQSPNEIIDWTSLSGLTFYEYQWDTSANFNSPLFYFASVSSGTSQATTANLLFGTTYYWRVRGRHLADTTQWSVIRSFTTIDQLSLVAPVNQAINQSPDEILDWTPLSGLTFYDYQWDTTASFNSPLLTSSSIASGTSQITTSNLRFGTTYFWRVRGRHTADTTQWSVVRSFTTINQLSLVAPVNLAINQAPNEILDWTPLSGLTFYDYQWDTTNSFNSPLLTFSSIASGTSQITTSNLRFGTTYYWRIRARHTTDTSLWSAIRSFTTTDQIFLTAPLNGATNVSANPILDWSPLSGILNYQYQIDTVITFTNPTSGIVGSGSSQATVTGLLSQKIYYWRVRAWHAADTTNWSTIRYFGVGLNSIVAPLFSQVGPYCNGTSIPSLPTSSSNGISGTWFPAINNTATTTYFFTPNSGQSAAATSMTININQPSSAVDVKSACISYEWIDGITYTQSTNSPTFTLTNSTGCDSIVTLNLTISPLEIDIQPISESVVENSEVIFTVNTTTSGATYQWQTDTGNGFVNIINGGQFSGATTNELIVSSITALNDNQQFRCLISTPSCSLASDIAILSVEQIVGIENARNTLSFYPNPTSDNVQLNVDASIVGHEYRLYDFTGKLMSIGRVESKQQVISLREFPVGIYMFMLSNNEFEPFKIVKF
jgi:Secretion system C-terminal sorting domain